MAGGLMARVALGLWNLPSRIVDAGSDAQIRRELRKPPKPGHMVKAGDGLLFCDRYEVTTHTSGLITLTFDWPLGYEHIKFASVGLDAVHNGLLLRCDNTRTVFLPDAIGGMVAAIERTGCVDIACWYPDDGLLRRDVDVPWIGASNG